MRTRFKNILLFLGVFAVVAGVFSFGFFRFSSPDTASEASVLDATQQAQHIASEPIFIAASAYPFIGDILKEVGGPFVKVEQVLRYGGADSVPADVFFVLDEAIDAWAVSAVRRGDADVRVFNLREGVGDAGEGYYWLSPESMADVTRYIARSFSEVDPVHAVQYFDNAYSYAYGLDDIYQQYREMLAWLRKYTFSMIGEGFEPLLKAYDLRKGASVSFALRDVERRLGSRTSEYMLAEVIFPADGIEDADMRRRMVILDPYGNLFSSGTYIDFLNENMRQLLDVR